MIYYKYLPFSHNSLNALYKKGLYFCAFWGFDDAFDGAIIPSPDPTPGRPPVEQQQANIDEAKKKLLNFGVLSLTTSWKNKKMWAAYADSFYGMCLGFELDDNTINKESDDFMRLTKVDYSVTNIVPSVKDTISLDTPITELYEFGIKHKAKEWSEQDESRLVCKKGPGVKNFPGKLKEVYFGCRMDESTKKFLYSFFSEYDVKFYSTRRELGTLDLERVAELPNDKMGKLHMKIKAFWHACVVHKLAGLKLFKDILR